MGLSKRNCVAPKKRLKEYTFSFCMLNLQFLNNLQDGDTSLSSHRLALTMLIKIVKSLGCAYGCGEGHRGLSGDRLRMQVNITVKVSLAMQI